MARPAPGQTGDQAHLVWGSLRWSIARSLRLVVITDEAAPSPLYVALLEGRDVVLGRGDISTHVPRDRRPPNLELYPWWVLKGDDELRPVP